VVKLTGGADVRLQGTVDAVQQRESRLRRRLDKREHVLLAEQFSGWVLGVGDAIGEQKQCVARVELSLADLVIDIRQHTWRRAGWLEALPGAIRTKYDRRVMATVDVVE